MNIEITTSPDQAESFAQRFRAVHENVGKAIKGKSGEIQLALTAMLAEGHVLIDDVPGTGKTSLAKALAHSIDGSWSRIQFTPDLLPSDVTGSMIYRGDDFQFHEGGVFANVVLADEINRASPKTQSALLEVMEERHVSIDRSTRPVPTPFVVLATQNPVEFDGTYRLPEAQIDRFMLRMSMGYPSHEAEMEVIAERLSGARPEDLSAVISVEEFEWMITTGRTIHVAESLMDYAVSIARSTRALDDQLRLGVSPRGTLALVRASQVWAASRGRHFVSADDIKRMAPFVLSHRMLLRSEAELQGVRAEDLIAQTLDSLPVPAVRV